MIEKCPHCGIELGTISQESARKHINNCGGTIAA